MAKLVKVNVTYPIIVKKKKNKRKGVCLKYKILNIKI